MTTVTISNIVVAPDVDRFGVNMGDTAPYGPEQVLKSFGEALGGYFQPPYWQTTFVCQNGGANDTTHWYNGSSGESAGYTTNFFVGASYIAIDASTGRPYGSGTITASTANSGSSGIRFTLGTPLSSACSTSNQDMLVVKFPNAVPGKLSPTQIYGGSVPSGATWNTSDFSPASSNSSESLELTSGESVQFSYDQVLLNATNTNSTLASQSVNWLNINGSYTATVKAKCLTSACSVTYSVTRGSSAYVSRTVSPTYNTAPGKGWTTYSTRFTGYETGSQDVTALMKVSCTGKCLIQDVDTIEGSTLSGNTTVYRDSVIRKLQALNPGSIRFMNGGDWCSQVADMISVDSTTGGWGYVRPCVSNTYVANAVNYTVPYWYKLQVAYLLNADCWLTVGQFNQATDWRNLINWLANSTHGPNASTSWISAFAAKGLYIYLEEGNEAWNSGTFAGLWAGNGTSYGYFVRPNITAAKAASGYNSSVIKLIANSWVAPNQGYGQYGWLARLMSTLGCSRSSRISCPDYVDNAPYTLGYLASFDASASNVSTTGAPFLDEWAEDFNIDTIPRLGSGEISMYQNVIYAKSTYNIGTAVYEVNYGDVKGTSSVTQLQMDQVTGSVGSALAIVEHLLLMRSVTGVTGPIDVFTLPQAWYYYNGGRSPVVPLWGIERYLACGPGQLSTCSDVDRPVSIAMQIVNNAIGSNNNVMSVQQRGTLTFNYAGGQSYGGTSTILANSAVPYVQAFAYANSLNKRWTLVIFNNNLSSSEPVTLAGSGAPGTATVTETLFGNNNNITDHNENSYIGSSSMPVVIMPHSKTATGNIYTIPAATMMVLTYSTGALPGSERRDGTL
jgi:hypothetical protein